MDLSEILAIAGKPGLFKVVTQSKNGVIVESLLDGKRITAFAHERISSLEEISIFGEIEDVPLKDVFKSIFDKQEGQAAINHKSSGNELKAFFEEVMPEYDQDRVYVSDIKKVIQWYNLLLSKDMLSFEDEAEEVTEKEAETSEDK
ncbi:MAG: hypothetical protein CL663_09165 [Bacteroidetes bacterium]|nr:hypothetical protein [Bacteroidota bacterium]